MTRPGMLVACCLLGGCTALLDYAPLTEASETDCHDGRDNDGDGHVDCLDDSCVHCIARTAITCPEVDWASAPLDGVVPTETCVPTFDPFEGCPTSAPDGALVIPALPGAFHALIGDHPPDVTPSDSVLEVWMAPGVHLEDGARVYTHVVLHGLCSGAQRATIEAPVGFGSPLTVDGGHLELDHVALRIRAGGPAARGRGGTLDLSHSTIESLEGPYVVLGLESGTTTRLDHVMADADVGVVGGHLALTDVSAPAVHATAARLDMDRTRVPMVYVEGNIATATIHQLFAECGAVFAREGPTVTLTDSVLSHAPTLQAILSTGSGGGGDLGALTIDDVVVVTSMACVPLSEAQREAISITGSEAHVTRLAVAATTGQIALRIQEAPHSTLSDASLRGGLAIDGSVLAIERISVPAADHAGIEIAGASEVTLHDVQISDIRPDADPGMCVPSAGGLVLHEGRLDVSRAYVDHVRDCGVFLGADARVDRLEVEIDGPMTGLCVTGRADVEALGAGLTLSGVRTPAAEVSDTCFARTCLPHGCLPANEVGLCDNGVDDDLDGSLDCADEECMAFDVCIENCTDGVDNDRNGAVDCGDPGCVNSDTCPAMHTPDPEGDNCQDTFDNDADARVDCEDRDCACQRACSAALEACPGADLGSSLGVVVPAASFPSARAWCYATPATCTTAYGTSNTYRWTAPAAGFYDFAANVNDGLFRGALQLLDGCGGNELACQEDLGGAPRASATLVMGQEIILRVVEFTPGSGATYSISIRSR